jgi:hypothetical protein
MIDSPPAGPAAGYPALLDALHGAAAPGRLVASAGGRVLASRAALPLAPDDGLARFGVAWTTAEPTYGEPAAAFTRGLLDLHCEVLRRTLAHAMAWLDGRTAEGSTLLARQLLQGGCADAAVEIAECESMCAAPDAVSPDVGWLISRRLVAAGRGLLDLLGAYGFLSDGVAADLYLAEVTANVYLHPGTE